MNQINNASDKMRKSDIILVLKPIDGKGKDSAGLLDTQLFAGGNRLHAVVDPQQGLWSMHYDKGVLPPALKGKFTSYNKLFAHASDYMKRRNVSIIEIID